MARPPMNTTQVLVCSKHWRLKCLFVYDKRTRIFYIVDHFTATRRLTVLVHLVYTYLRVRVTGSSRHAVRVYGWTDVCAVIRKVIPNRIGCLYLIEFRC